jgi:hypothetical protein
MLPAELRTRKERLQAAFNELSGTPEIVRSDLVTLTTGEPVVRFRHNIRIQPASLRFTVWEEFRDLHAEPQLYAFSYHVSAETDVEATAPLFRYECHPDVGDPGSNNGEEDETMDFKSPYEREPHFHPDHTGDEHIRKLHFPFHRSERKSVVFALVQWLRVDLVRRFHHV